MGFSDYQGRKWKVITDGSTECPRGARVIFQGPASGVFVHCGGTPRYGRGTYDESSQTITRAGAYEIAMMKSTSNDAPTTITFTSTRQSGLSTQDTGSWTAEDNGPWSGDV